jgi:Fic family protein
LLLSRINVIIASNNDANNMDNRLMTYIWQKANWPDLTWRTDEFLSLHGKVRYHQGAFLEKISSLGFDLSQSAHAGIMVEDVIKTSAIEGEYLNLDAVRSSVCRKLGLPNEGPQHQDQRVEGAVTVLHDATLHYKRPLTAQRIWGWQAALFPTGYSGLSPITVGQWRKDLEGPMQVVSGPYGKEKVHFEAPPAAIVDKEMQKFLSWFNNDHEMDGILKAALAHLWYVTIHPLDDGNGRIARAITDMSLAMDEGNPQRFYSLSSQIMSDRAKYYEVLKETQRGDLDITVWMTWFLKTMDAAISSSEKKLGSTMAKARFWNHFAQTNFNERQEKVLNRLLDAGPKGFDGGLKNKKYVGITHTSRATAQRELADLIEKGALIQLPGGGRNTSYGIDWEKWIPSFDEDIEIEEDSGPRM